MLRPALALTTALLVAACSGSPAADVARDADGRPTAAGPVRADRLRIGDCFDDQDDRSPDDFPVVPCDEPHDNELFARFRAPGGDYPGEDALADLAVTRCRGDDFTGYVGEPLDGSGYDVFQFLPSEQTWNRDGDREIYCALYAEDRSKLRGSAAG